MSAAVAANATWGAPCACAPDARPIGRLPVVVVVVPVVVVVVVPVVVVPVVVVPGGPPPGGPMPPRRASENKKGVKRCSREFSAD